MIGPMIVPMPKIAIAWPCRSGGLMRSSVACDSGMRPAPQIPWSPRESTSCSRLVADPHKAEAIVNAVEVILSNEKVTAVLFNIFGGITRCDEVANGLIAAFAQISPTVPFVVRLDGTNDEEGRRLLAEANLPNVHTEATMLGAAEKVVELSRA